MSKAGRDWLLAKSSLLPVSADQHPSDTLDPPDGQVGIKQQ